MKRFLVVASAVIGLVGCNIWSPSIRHDLVDYTDVLENTGNQLLLINVLEARDNAPLHFAAIPNIHGSLTGSATLAATDAFELGTEGKVIPGTTAGKVGTPGAAFLNGAIDPTIAVSDAPSFEVDSVETKDFVTGVTSPIDAKYIKFWVDRGLDKRIILLFFFSSAQITEKIYAWENGQPPGTYIVNLTEKGKSAIGKLCQGKSAKLQLCVDFEKQKSLPEIRCNAAYVSLLKTDEAKTDPDGATEKKVVEKYCERKVLGTQTITVFNSPRKSADQLAQCWDHEHHDRGYYIRETPPFPATSCHDITQFEHYLTLIDGVQNAFTANAYRERKTLSGEFAIDLAQHLKDVGKLDPKKYELEFRKPKAGENDSSGAHSEGAKKGVYELFSSDDDKNIVLCFNRSSALSGVAAERGEDATEMCTKSVVTKPIADPNKGDDPDYPTDPTGETLWSSGQCAGTQALPGAIATAREDLDYCTILKRFVCYANGAAVSGSRPIAQPTDTPDDGQVGGSRKKYGPLAASAQTQYDWTEPVVAASPKKQLEACATWPDDAFTIQFTVRSPIEMIRFVGDLLYYQSIMQGPDLYHNVPLTLGWETTAPDANTQPLHPTTDSDPEGINGRADCNPHDGGCVFVVHQGSGDSRIEVTYRNRSYFIAKQQPNDHTLEVMSIIHQLVDLNKSATDLRTTPTVQVVP